MRISWNRIILAATLAALLCLFVGNGLFVQSAIAQEYDPDEEIQEIDEADGEETDGEEAPAPVVKGPDPDAKGAPPSEYMHGITDGKATAIDMSALLNTDQEKYIDADEKLPPNASHEGVVLALSNEKIRLASAMLTPEILADNRGDILRFHIWIKAEGVEATDNLWSGSPTLLFELFDDNGNLVTSATSYFKTRGTYPWHNYYVDVPIPRQFTYTGKSKVSARSDQLLDLLGITTDVQSNTPGLFLTLSNLGGGTAWFGGLSYERIMPRDQARKESWLDDETGTFAPNPRYDELPMLLYYGLDTKLPWRFLEGNKNAPAIRTIDGLRKYVASAKNDWFHMQRGVAMLPYLFVTANVLKLSTAGDFEDGWLAALRKELESLQDPATGFWKINGIPNLLVTKAIVDRCFSPFAVKHGDAEPIPTPWNTVAPDAEVKYARQIIRSLLDEQVGDTGAWSSYAFQPKEMGDTIRQTRTEITPTAAAVVLLERAKESLSVEDKEYELAERAILNAYKYVVENFIIKDRYLWRENNTQAMPAPSPDGFFELLNATSVLEERINDELPLPTLSLTRTASANLEKASVTWPNPERGLVAVRIYAAPAEFNPALLTEKHLIGIIERPNTLPKNQDPLMLAINVAAAARLHWNTTPEEQGADYLAEKIANTALFLGGPKRLTAGIAGEKPVIMNVSSPMAFGFHEDELESVTIKVYAAGVNANGETTRRIPLDAEDEE